MVQIAWLKKLHLAITHVQVLSSNMGASAELFGERKVTVPRDPGDRCQSARLGKIGILLVIADVVACEFASPADQNVMCNALWRRGFPQ